MKKQYGSTVGTVTVQAGPDGCIMRVIVMNVVAIFGRGSEELKK